MKQMEQRVYQLNFAVEVLNFAASLCSFVIFKFSVGYN